LDSTGKQVDNVTYQYIKDAKQVDFAKGNTISTKLDTKTTTINKKTRMVGETVNEVTKGAELSTKGKYLRFNESILTEIISEAYTPPHAPIVKKSIYANVLNAYKAENRLIPYNPAQNVDFGNYSGLVLPSSLRLPYLNYAQDNIKGEVLRIGLSDKGYKYGNRVDYLDKAETQFAPELGRSQGYFGMKENQIVNSLGHWYAEYSLPRTLIVKDASGKELNNGYIIVMFKITTLDENGKAYLAYYPNEKASQWSKENTNVKSGKVPIKLPKTVADVTAGVKDTKTVNLNVSNGYYPVAIYEAGQRLSADVAGTH
jgi:hypothetical protein